MKKITALHLRYPWFLDYAGMMLAHNGKTAILVDTALEGAVGTTIEPALRQAGLGWNDLKWVVNTHSHFDHIGCNAAIKQRSAARFAVHEAGAEELRKCGTPPDLLLAEGTRIGDDELSLIAIHTPALGGFGLLSGTGNGNAVCRGRNRGARHRRRRPGAFPGSGSLLRQHPETIGSPSKRCLHAPAVQPSVSAVRRGGLRRYDRAVPARMSRHGRRISNRAGGRAQNQSGAFRRKREGTAAGPLRDLIIPRCG